MIATLLLYGVVLLALSGYSVLLLAIFAGKAFANGVVEGERRERLVHIAHSHSRPSQRLQ